jgi:EmrB/QacA subfamily drug resistance transporter
MTTNATAPTAAPTSDIAPAPAPAALRAPETDPDLGRHELAALLVVLTGTFMITLDFFIVNVAIPTMHRDLRANSGEIQWIVAGYGLAIASGVITAGRLGDLFGRRRMYALGLALFTLASLACGVASTAGELVGARVAQGVAAALLTPQVLAILSTSFKGRSLTRAFTAYGLTMGVAAVFGQLIGGLLIQADVLGLGWRSCFLINVPIGLVTLVLVPRFVPRAAGTRTARLDLVGMTLVTLALVAAVLPLIEGQPQHWPLWTFISLGVAAALFVVFVAHQRWFARRGGAPHVDMSMFTSRGFSVGVLAQLAFWMGQASFFLVLALYLQDGRGLSALTAGVVFAAIGGGYLATSVNAGRIAARLGRQSVALGTLIMVVGLVAMDITVRAIGTDASIAWLVPSLIVDGAGMGIALSPLAQVALSQVAPKHAGAASGVLSSTMQVGGALGVAIIGVVFYRALPGGYPHALSAGLTFLACVELATAGLVQFLPRPTQ